MTKKEFDKLENDEKLVVIYWRIIDFPKELEIREIADRSRLSEQFVLNTIKKINYNFRLKLELFSLKKDLDDMRKLIYWKANNT